ncbi:hypothetical protein HY635_01820, partial [Candidatus Uhrbacteria bacterium]|nr:hypothetical protein [Candidatus Uhrbacteria bacterium]
PRHSLTLLVAIAAAVIAVMWFTLFRSHALTPSVAIPAGPSLPEIGKQFDKEIETFNRLLEPAVNGVPAAPVPPTAPVAPAPGAASDDVRSP